MKEIKLTKGMVALVDDEDFESVNQHKWHASLESRGCKHYAVRRVTVEKGKRKKVRMHHYVLGLRPIDLTPGHVVDHIDHNSLNNQKKNLRIITQTENMLASPGWKKKAAEPFL